MLYHIFVFNVFLLAVSHASVNITYVCQGTLTSAQCISIMESDGCAPSSGSTCYCSGSIVNILGPGDGSGTSSLCSPAVVNSICSGLPGTCTQIVSASSCFPGAALVQLVNGSNVKIQDINIGDSVAVSEKSFSVIYMFSHKYSEARYPFLQIETAANQRLLISHGHYLYANDILVVAQDVKIGDFLETFNGAKTAVTRVSSLTASGLFNPHTLHGDIIVVSMFFFNCESLMMLV